MNELKWRDLPMATKVAVTSVVLLVWMLVVAILGTLIVLLARVSF